MIMAAPDHHGQPSFPCARRSIVPLTQFRPVIGLRLSAVAMVLALTFIPAIAVAPRCAWREDQIAPHHPLQQRPTSWDPS
ncbi:MAG: hypothetical protein M0C28_31505 [Candidatus Moduliflexus flocculans]|nr:hypothetical protein [Candidatus Moduliflexus flocculans]